ncbi:MAG: MEKHLA domain-containing protein, partial [Planctomycetia bacterium]|nr:MEKHLA domain-containing protein [Planctomycetia bacterium]
MHDSDAAWLTRATEILDSFRRRLGRDLVERSGDPAEDARRLFDLPLAILAHDTSPQPLLDWVNRAAAEECLGRGVESLGRRAIDPVEEWLGR